MKFTLNIKKQHFYILIILILFLGFGFVIASDWRDAGKPQSHDSVWTKEILGKDVDTINVEDNLNVKGKLCIKGVCINSWNEIIPAAQTLWYKDEDGDNYASSVTMLSNTRPSPTNQWKSASELIGLTGLNDCYDKSANAFPGQTEYFQYHRGDNSFDYDCDGVISYKVTESVDNQCYSGGVDIILGRIGDTEYVCEGTFAAISMKRTGNTVTCYAQSGCPSYQAYSPRIRSAYRK